MEQRPPAGSAESLLAGNPCEALEGLPESVTLIPREVSAITKTLMTEAKSSFLRIDPKVSVCHNITSSLDLKGSIHQFVK